jgi:hypothetical protein
MMFRIIKETCHGKPPTYRAQRSRLGLFWVSCWYEGYPECSWPQVYDSRDKAAAAIVKWKLGCVTEIEPL